MSADRDLALDAETLAARLRASGHRVVLDWATDAAGAGAVLGFTPRTLKQWRRDGCGPPFMQAQPRGLVLYPLEGLAAFLAERTVVPRAV